MGAKGKTQSTILARWSLVVGVVILAAVAITLLAIEIFEGAAEVRILPFVVGGDSPYTCFVAVESANEVLAMDCIDTSLTILSPAQ